MKSAPFFLSLHRPLNQPLKAVKWVCGFLNAKKNKVKSSEINVDFYLFLIKSLHTQYATKQLGEYNGVPSANAINEIYSHIGSLSQLKQKSFVQDCLKETVRSSIQKQVYSTYKAASYFVNMAKDKMGLIDDNNKVTELGKTLLTYPAPFFRLSTKEKDFFIRILIEKDFLLLISLCLFKRLGYVYNFKNYVDSQFDFLDKFYGIKHFNFTSQSLNNYNTVRNYWIESLGMVNAHLIIKPNILKTILENPEHAGWYKILVNRFEVYENENFKQNRLYYKRKIRFESQYKTLVAKGQSDLGFVNIHDLKSEMRMSFDVFEMFLNEYYENEKSKKSIFLSNIVSSIDRRQRFKVRNAPVIKVRIKDI